MPRQGGCCNSTGDRDEGRRQGGCCNDSRRSTRRDGRSKHRDILYLSRSIRQLKAIQCTILAVYFGYSVTSTRPGQALIPILTFLTLLITVSLVSACAIGGDKSKGFLVLSITSDSICISLQLITIIGLFVAKSLVSCFGAGSGGRQGSSCGVVWAALFLSNALIITFIHSIVRAAILISTLRCHSRQQPPISNPDEDPPAYPALDRDFPLYHHVDSSTSDVDGGKSSKGGHKDTSPASSATLTEVIITPDSSAESDADDNAREDGPLLHLGRP